MATRTERLDRLVIQSPCSTAWQAMDGGERSRFCLHCNRHVHDLAALEARQVEALVDATQGRFCARITRDAAGRLVTREPRAPLLPALPAPPPRRASPAAAAVVTALMGLSGAAWATGGGHAALQSASPVQAATTAATGAATLAPATPSPARQAGPAGAVLAGQIVDESGPLPEVLIAARNAGNGREHSTFTGADGAFTFEDLPAGTYTVAPQLEGFTFPTATVDLGTGRRTHVAIRGEAQSMEMGIIALPTEEPLRQVVGRSSLVAIATVGSSIPTGDPAELDELDDTEVREVRTELHLTAVLKGSHRGGTVTVLRHEVPAEETLRPGDTILALLDPGEEDEEYPQADRAYVEADPLLGLQKLPDETLRAYQRSIEELVRVERARPSEVPEALAEWLVATAEDELTRKEAVGELKRAFEAFAERQPAEAAEAPGSDGGAAEDGEIEPGDLGAALTAGHRDRLVQALLATESLTGPDLDLYDLVRPWAGEAAERWLMRVFREGEPEPSWQLRRVELRLLEELDAPELEQLVERAYEEIEAIVDRLSDETASWTPTAVERLDAEVLAVEKRLRERFLRTLDGATP